MDSRLTDQPDGSPTSAVVADVRSPVIDAGPHRSEAVVFVHGNPGTGHDWDHLIPRVARFGRAVAPDMPGFGGADKPPDFEYTIDGYARHLAGVLDQLGIERAHLVLHDFGGALGPCLGPRPVRKRDAHQRGCPPRLPLAQLCAYLAHAGVGRALPSHGFAGGLSRLAWTRESAVEAQSDRSHLRAERGLADQAGGAAPLPGHRARLRRADGRAVSSPRPTGTRRLGGDDAYLPREQAERQRESFPSARVEVLEGHGHWVIWEDPERVAALVVPFLEEQLGAGAAPARRQGD